LRTAADVHEDLPRFSGAGDRARINAQHFLGQAEQTVTVELIESVWLIRLTEFDHVME
jgi:hypothetical protein